MNRQTFAKVRLNRKKVQLVVLILACFLGLVAQPSTHSQGGDQPQPGTLATSSLGVTVSNRNPLQIALLH